MLSLGGPTLKKSFLTILAGAAQPPEGWEPLLSIIFDDVFQKEEIKMKITKIDYPYNLQWKMCKVKKISVSLPFPFNE